MGGELSLPLKGVSKCDGLPACKCMFILGCYFHASTIGHAGLDYGSGMILVGRMLELNVSYALALNTGESPMGMNTSLGVQENANFLQSAYCEAVSAIVHAQIPTYPAFRCS